MSITVLPVAKLKEHIGEEKKSDWIDITQERINRFADCTEDHQFIHVDPEKAKTGPFGRTIAHGFLTLSLLPRFSSIGAWVPEGIKAVINYGLNKVRFVDPVPSGSKIQDTMKLASVEEKGNGRILVTVTHTVNVEGSEKPAMVAESLAMFVV
ncbi:MAG: enoyl-CoA hydratase [Spirochaetes bacterium RBG_16_49_21]|nr:MAG: enoyl-CoA hydratase [Spirochaetes bacterium RBG_16_49_21]